MKIISVILAFLSIGAALHAQPPLELPEIVPSEGNHAIGSPLTFYKPMYALFGNMHDQVKVQLSFKYDPFYQVVDNLGLYFGYTQLMEWRLYDESAPFRDINYNPELFWRVESGKNIFRNIDLGYLDYFQLGLIEHKSNGKDGDDSRSWNRWYLQVQAGVGSTLRLGANLKFFVLLVRAMEHRNRNIQDYIGSWEATVFLRHQKSNGELGYGEIYASFGAGGGPMGLNFYRGYQEIGIVLASLFTRVKPYVQLYHGYAEFLLDYDHRRTGNWNGTCLHRLGSEIRVGVIMQ